MRYRLLQSLWLLHMRSQRMVHFQKSVPSAHFAPKDKEPSSTWKEDCTTTFRQQPGFLARRTPCIMGLGSKHHAAHASRLETRMMRAVGIHPVAELKHTSVQVTIPSTAVLWDRRVVLGNSWESGNGISMSIEQSVTASLRMACSTCHRLQGNLCGTGTSGCSSLMAETSTPCTGPLIRWRRLQRSLQPKRAAFTRKARGRKMQLDFRAKRRASTWAQWCQNWQSHGKPSHSLAKGSPETIEMIFLSRLGEPKTWSTLGPKHLRDAFTQGFSTSFPTFRSSLLDSKQMILGPRPASCSNRLRRRPPQRRKELRQRRAMMGPSERSNTWRLEKNFGEWGRYVLEIQKKWSWDEMRWDEII